MILQSCPNIHACTPWWTKKKQKTKLKQLKLHREKTSIQFPCNIGRQRSTGTHKIETKAVPDGPQDTSAKFRHIKMVKKSVSAHSYKVNDL